MDITNCTKEELAQSVLELTIELGKTRRALNAALEKESLIHNLSRWKDAKPKVSGLVPPSVEKSFPTLDPMAVDPRSVV